MVNPEEGPHMVVASLIVEPSDNPVQTLNQRPVRSERGSGSRVAVGVDGGQSTIRMRIVGCSKIMNRPGVSHVGIDTQDGVVSAVAELWGGRTPSPARLVAGLSTVPASADDRLHLGRRLADATGAREVWIAGDEVTGHAGAFGGRMGVYLAAGTGVACFAYDPHSHRVRNFDGAGYLIGDEGGGFWIGRAAIRAAIAANEGRGPGTSLAPAVAERYGSLDDLAVRLHTEARAVDRIAQAAVLVSTEAEAGDELAAGIMRGAVERLTNTVGAAVAFLGSGAPVALDGRLLGKDTILAEQVKSLISDFHPQVRIRFAEGSGLAGACHLAAAETAGLYERLFTVFPGRP